MEKRTFQDVVPPTERSVRRIPIAGRPATIRTTSQPAPTRVRSTPTPPPAEPRQREQTPPPRRERHFEPLTPPRSRQPRNNKKVLIGALIIAAIIIIIAVISIFFSVVEVRVTPKHSQVKVEGVYTAQSAGSTNTPSLRYIVATSTAVVSEVVPASKGSIVQTKAKGKVTISNSSATAPQKLVATTRLQTADGTIYRLDSAVTVPAVTVSGGKTIPGTITTSVTADQYGDSYNLRLADGPFTFTFPGFKGTTKYDIFTAKAASDITGGYFGTKNVIAASVAKEASDRLQKKLSETLIANIKNIAASSTYVLYDAGYVLDTERLSDISKGTNSSEIRYSGTIYVPMFEAANLVASIAKTESERLGGANNVTVEGLENLSFAARDLKATTLKKKEPFSFALRGNIAITGKVNETDLRNNLKGLSLSESNGVFAKYPTIASADVSTIPSWVRWFPKSDSRIKIEVQQR